MVTSPVASPKIDPRYVCFNLAIQPSKIHRYGVYTLEEIPKNRKVMEYTGQRLTTAEADAREDGEYTYLFELDKDTTIDGAVGGSGAEIINHSCDPNLISRVMKGHIIYMSLRVIQPGEELTIDYQFPAAEQSPCRCGTANCRGKMGKAEDD
jgi:SET domain-containing protein